MMKRRLRAKPGFPEVAKHPLCCVLRPLLVCFPCVRLDTLGLERKSRNPFISFLYFEIETQMSAKASWGGGECALFFTEQRVKGLEHLAPAPIPHLPLISLADLGKAATQMEPVTLSPAKILYPNDSSLFVRHSAECFPSICSLTL